MAWKRTAWVLLLVGCGSKNPATEPASEPEEAVIAAAGSSAETAAPESPSLLLDGVKTTVRWDDGDTFGVVRDDGERGLRARLAGFNTLESYGPVHRWGDWTAAELYGLSKAGGELASGQVWTCVLEEGSGGYGRSRVDCPDLRQALLAAGLAHLFAFDEAPDPQDLSIQTQAQADGAGMWARGVPSVVVTSLHSLDEKEGQEETYNRVVDTATGMARKVDHAEIYVSCQEVCIDGSCMVYVPYGQRYGDDRAVCLR